MSIGIGNIVQDGEPVLRKKAEAVRVADIGGKAVQGVIARMSEELAHHIDGVAIAAPQLGESLRIFLVSRRVFALSEDGRLPDENDPEAKKLMPKTDLVCINPKIVKLSKKRRWVPEGCLSVRWKYGETHRAEKATIEAYDEHGKKFTRGGSGLLAQIFQHETDHLEGILFVDHARDIEEILPEELIEELDKKKKKK
jgi:peptide deformylase